MPPKANNQYDFIMNEQKRAKRPGITLPDNGTPGGKILLLVGLFGVIILFFFLVSFIVGRSGEDKTVFLTLLQQQTELNRVAGLGAVEASSNQSIQNASTNIQVVVTSDQQQLTSALTAKKITFKPKALAKSTNPATDQRLADAKAAANFDSVYMSILNEQLVDYQGTLQQTYNTTKSKSVKETLSKSYEHTKELKKQLDATQP